MEPLFQTTVGSDIRIRLTFRDNTGNAVNLTGYSISILEASIGIVNRVTPTILDVDAGLTEVFVEGTEPLDKSSHSFRVQLQKAGADSIGSPLIRFEVV